MYFPQSLAHGARALKTNTEAFLLIPFQETMSYLINTHHVPREGWELVLGGRGRDE